MRLFLIRHGETDYNQKRIMQGHGEVPLNERGKSQAERLAKRLAGMSLEHIYASDLRRAAMTASAIAEHTGAPLEYNPAFRERDPGQLTETSYDESVRFFTDRSYEPPSGESFPVFEERIVRAFEGLLEKEGDRGRTIAVVTHGMVCGAFLRCCVGGDLESYAGVRWPNASLTIAHYRNPRWDVEIIGDASHLEELSDGAFHSTGA